MNKRIKKKYRGLIRNPQEAHQIEKSNANYLYKIMDNLLKDAKRHESLNK